MNIKQFVFPAILLVSLVFSCKDKVDPPVNNDPGKSSQVLLSQKNWKITSIVSGTTDIWSLPNVLPCNKDNQFWFRTDDSLTIYEMSQKCNSTDPDSTHSFYKLYNGNSQIILNIKLTSSVTLDDTAEIIELKEGSMKLNAEYSGLPATISFVHP